MLLVHFNVQCLMFIQAKNIMYEVISTLMHLRSGMQAIQLEIPEGTEIFEDARSSPPKKNSMESTQSTGNYL